MPVVQTPEAGDLPGLDALLDVILGPKLAQLYGDTALLERIECKLGMVLDRHHPDEVENFHQLVGMTKSDIIKEKNLQVFVKGIIGKLVEDASRPPVSAAKPKAPAAKAGGGGGGGGASNNKRAKPAGGNGGGAAKRAKKPSAAVASAAASKSSAGDSVSSLDEISRSSMSDDESAAASAAPKKAAAPAPARKPAVVVDSYDTVMADSDGQMRGQLHLVERCPAFVYSSWRDMDHDVYLFQFPLLGAAKREAYPNGVIGFFPGFGLYKEYTEKAFRSVAMPGDQPTKLRSREEIFNFLQKGTQMRSTAKGGSGEGARRKAYVAAWQFFQKHIFKEAVCTEDPFPPLARRVPSKSKKRSSTSSLAPKKPRARAASLPAALPPLPPAAPLALPVPPSAVTLPPAVSTLEEKAGAGVAALASPQPPTPLATSAPTPPQPAAAGPAAVVVGAGGGGGGQEGLGHMMGSEGAPSPLGEEAPDEVVEGGGEGDVWATLPDPDDRSIRGLFSSLRWRLERLEEVWEGGDQFVWTLKSSQSNIDNLCDNLFGDPGDPEADDWKRMVGSSLDKARKKLEDKLRAIGSQGGAGATSKPAYVHGRALLDIYADLKEAVAGFEEGMEGEVEGWDSMDFPVRVSAAGTAAVAATPAAAAEEDVKEPVGGGEGGEAMHTEVEDEGKPKEEEEEEEEQEQMEEGTGEEEGEAAPAPVTSPVEEDEQEKDGSVAAELPGGSMDEEGAGSTSSLNDSANASATPKPTDAGEEEEEKEEEEEEEEEEEAEEEAEPALAKAAAAQEVNGEEKEQEQERGEESVSGSES